MKAKHGKNPVISRVCAVFYIVFLKENLHTFLLELPNSYKAIDRVSCEAADGLGENKVDFPGKGIFYHSVEAFALFGVRAGDAFISVNVLWTISQWLKKLA